MRDAASLIFALLLVGGVLLALLFLRYRSSPPALWRARVRRHLLALRGRLGLLPPGQRGPVELAVRDTERLAMIARDVSFWNTLFHAKVPGLTDEVLHRELPEAEVFAAGGGEPGPTPPRLAPARREEPKDPPSVARLRAVCRFGYLVAKADGRVAKAERVVLREYAGRVFASDPVALRFLDPTLEQLDAAPPNEADAIAGVKDFPAADRRDLLALAARIAAATGQTGAKEQQLLARLHAALADPSDPRTVLDIPPGVEITAEVVRRKFHMKGGTAEAKAAAEELLKPLGVPLETPPPPPPPTDLRHNPDLDDVFGA